MIGAVREYFADDFIMLPYNRAETLCARMYEYTTRLHSVWTTLLRNVERDGEPEAAEPDVVPLREITTYADSLSLPPRAEAGEDETGASEPKLLQPLTAKSPVHCHGVLPARVSPMTLTVTPWGHYALLRCIQDKATALDALDRPESAWSDDFVVIDFRNRGRRACRRSA